VKICEIRGKRFGLWFWMTKTGLVGNHQSVTVDGGAGITSSPKFDEPQLDLGNVPLGGGAGLPPQPRPFGDLRRARAHARILTMREVL